MNELQNMTNNTITSMEVAEMVGKDHKNLLADLRKYTSQLAELKIQPGDFFTESTYKDTNNQTRPCYFVTKKGCEFIAHKLTGVKGTEFTAKYINRFHEMEQGIGIRKLTAIEQLQLQNQAILEVNEKVDAVHQELETLKLDLPILPIEADRITTAVKKKGVEVLGGKSSNAYSDRSLRQKVYNNLYSNLKYQFGTSSYKSIKRNECDKAIEVINGYKPPIFLQRQIDEENAQEKIV